MFNKDSSQLPPDSSQFGRFGSLTDATRAKLAKAGIAQTDMVAAVDWARTQAQPPESIRYSRIANQLFKFLISPE